MPKPIKNKKALVVAFDAECLVNAQRSGVAYYTGGLIESLAKNYDNVELVGHYFNFLGRRTTPELPKAHNISYTVTKICPAKVPNLLRRLGFWLPFELFTWRRADFHIFPAFLGWPSLFGAGSAPMIHDLAFLDHPDLVNNIARFDLNKLVPKEIKRASFIITNSEFSAKRLKQEFRVGSKPIVIGHIPPVNNIDIAPDKAKKLIARLGVAGKYILFLGNIEPRKNLPRLIAAFSRQDPATREQYSLVLAGGKGWLDSGIIESIDKARAEGIRIITPGYVSDDQRAALYQNATALTMVSTYEGFGMPLLEAMNYRTPVLASNIPAHREASDGAALYCDPDNVDDIARKLKLLLGDADLRASMIRNGTRRLKDFSWDRVASMIMEKLLGSLAK